MKRLLFMLAAFSMAVMSCRNGKVVSEESPSTRLIVETAPEAIGDSIRIYIENGVEEEINTYPILDDMFALDIPTDRMKLGSFLISYDGGLSSGFFIPEGGKIHVTLDKKGRVDVQSDKENSLTMIYRSMSDELTKLQAKLVRKRDSLFKADNPGQAERDSMNAEVVNALNAKLRSQAKRMIKEQGDNVLGVLGVMNLIDIDGADAVRPLLRDVDKRILDHPAIPDSLKN